jgi:MFS-type transporter involved in bile tolerance (Atg22 family)
MLIHLVPPGQLGKYFGLYNVGRKLSVIGVITFGVLADLELPDVTILGHTLNAVGPRLGMLVQVVLLSLGILLIYKVDMGDGR